MQRPQRLKPIIIIPARLAATRLPNKPMADIHGQPMIVHVWRRAIEANIAPVIVACDHEAIFEAIRDVGGLAILTDPDLPSGSDRVYDALNYIDEAGGYNCVINLQGDMPLFAPNLLPEVVRCLRQSDADIATLAALFTDQAEAENPNKVKIALSRIANSDLYRAHYFSRAAIPHGEAPRYHHLGIYAYRRAALERFIALPPSELEKSEKLEQLRALADGMKICVAVVDAIPIGVDTPEDLIAARQAMMP